MHILFCLPEIFCFGINARHVEVNHDFFRVVQGPELLGSLLELRKRSGIVVLPEEYQCQVAGVGCNPGLVSDLSINGQRFFGPDFSILEFGLEEVGDAFDGIGGRQVFLILELSCKADHFIHVSHGAVGLGGMQHKGQGIEQFRTAVILARVVLK